MVLSKTMKRQSKETYISLYVPLLRGHLRTEAQSKIDDIKQAVIEMGGKTNAGCRFLKAGCKDTYCTSNNTVTCKGVLQIPRNQTWLSKNLLRSLDSGRLHTFNIILLYLNNIQYVIHMKKY